MRFTKSQFIERAEALHGNKYSYRKVEYKNAQTKVTIYCRKCKAYFDQVAAAHLRGQGCPECARSERNDNNRMSLKDFVEKSRSIHGDKYDYSQVDYRHSHTKVKIKCRKCKATFEQTAGNHIRGRGCDVCFRVGRRKGLDTFIAQAREIHGDKYGYDDVQYKSARYKVSIFCRRCNTSFTQTPHSHLTGCGCRKCSLIGFSQIALDWLRHESKARRIKIQHADNGGEYQIPGTRFKADGYHAKSNTIFEFYGDAFHGNLKRYAPDSKPHPFSRKTAKQLHEATKRREQKLRSMGYNVVTMWESDWTRLR